MGLNLTFLWDRVRQLYSVVYVMTLSVLGNACVCAERQYPRLLQCMGVCTRHALVLMNASTLTRDGCHVICILLMRKRSRSSGVQHEKFTDLISPPGPRATAAASSRGGLEAVFVT